MKTYILVIMSLSSDRGCLHISAYIRIQGKRVSHQITNIRTLTLEVNIFVSVSVFHLSYLSLRNIYTPISLKLTTIRQHFSSEQTCYVYVHDKLFHAPSLSATKPGTLFVFFFLAYQHKIHIDDIKLLYQPIYTTLKGSYQVYQRERNHIGT